LQHPGACGAQTRPDLEEKHDAVTRAQGRIVGEIEELLRIGSYDWRVVEELYEPDARLEQLKRIKLDFTDISPTIIVKQRFEAVGGELMEVAPDRLSGIIKADYDRWIAIIREAGIRLE
jgi:hypothetical protein